MNAVYWYLEQRELDIEITKKALNIAKEWNSNMTIDENEKEKRNEILKRIGFVNSVDFTKSNLYIRVQEVREVIDWYRKNFPNCIFMTRDDFVEMLDDYNLVCGRMSDYLGNIPTKNLEEIVEVKEKLELLPFDNNYGNRENQYNSFEMPPNYSFIKGKMKDTFLKKLEREDKDVFEKIYIERRLEADVFEKNIRRYPFYYNSPHALRRYDNKELLIAAPAKDMIKEKNTFFPYTENKYVLIFQLFPYGVVIYNKWGDEADAI